MSFSGEIWNYLNCNFFADDDELLSSAKLSPEKASATARLCGEKEGWSSETMRLPHLVVEDGELIWRIRFASVDENNLPVKGGHLILSIDDETGDLIDKVVGTR